MIFCIKKNFGVTFDRTLSLDQDIKEITWTTISYLRIAAKILSFMSVANAEIPNYTFVSS